MTRIWKLDGEIVDWRKIIKLAEEYGYESDSGIYQTSIACRYLEKNGHKVDCEKAHA